ncbi:hypothetical protein KJI95_07425 [Shewanella sp. JM162201]|uniref:Peptidase M16 C-terminal domain-containing protein n=1 Tax=Shewanella jiangmenensis TaxID=2837387 RepID=A0ABS5V1J7_9GAMM|nr:insulinase family protein [Shewanella jiangmenensis]MBT1444355.1 hypothetical protein [Shewanella jiangmenensis]
MKLSKRLARLSLSAAMLAALIGCQHTQLSFDAALPPKLADFSAEANPGLPPFPHIAAPKPAKFAFVHGDDGIDRAADPRLGENQLLFTSAPPFIHGAMAARALLANARQQALAGDGCAEMLKISAGPHSLRFSSGCDSPEQLSQRASALMSSIESLSDQEYRRILREQKLASHIDAFSGNDIDRLWAKLILGKGHPYLELDSPFDGNQAVLAERLAAFRASASVLLISAADNGLATAPFSSSRVSSKPVSSQPVSSQSASSNPAPEPPKNTAETPSLLKMVASPKRLYLLDAPGQVQAQVRIGYGLSPQGSSRDCRALAALLGRSQSGRLFYDLRSQRGLTYGVYGSCIDNPLARTLKFYGASANASAGAFVRGILDHLTLLSQSAPGDAELEMLSSFLSGQQKLIESSSTGALSNWVDARIHGKPFPAPPQALLDRTALNTFASTVLATPPLVVIKGDADVIRADFEAKLPGWHIEVLSKLPE